MNKYVYRVVEDNNGERSVMGIANTLENAYKLAENYGYVEVEHTDEWELERAEPDGYVFDRVTIEEDIYYTGGDDEDEL